MLSFLNNYINKRMIVAFVITVFVIVVTRGLWSALPVTSVDFDIIGNGKINVLAQLSRKNNNLFNHISSEDFDIDLSDNNKYSLNFYNNVRMIKQVRFRLSNLKVGDTYVIRNIDIDKGKYKLNLDKFLVIDGVLKFDNGKLIVKATGDRPVWLIYTDYLNVYNKATIDCELFIIILILSFLLSYKITNFIADFKSIKNNSRIDILFLTVFFILLIIPMCHITRDDMSVEENKELAKFPIAVKVNKLNYNYFKEFSEWFEDRFQGKQLLVSAHKNIKRYIVNDYSSSNDYMLLKDGYYFSKKQVESSKNKFSADKYDNVLKKLRRLEAFCEKNNIKLYFLFNPIMENVYSDYYVVKNYDYPKKECEFLKANGFNVIRTYDIFVANKNKKMLYFKTDGHMTDEGGYLSYLDVMSVLNKDFKNINVVKRTDFKVEQHDYVDFEFVPYIYKGGRVDSSSPVKVDNYDYYRFDDSKIKKDIDLDRRVMTTYNKDGYPKNLVLLGVSFGEQMNDFFIHTFKNYKRIRSNYGDYFFKDRFLMSRFEKELIDFHTDILILNLPDGVALLYDELYKD